MRERWRSLRPWILPPAEQRDGALRKEFVRQSHRGLRLIGALSIAVPLLLLVAGFPLLQAPAGRLPAIVTACIGAAALIAAQTRWGRTRSRGLAVITLWLTGASLGLLFLALSPDPAGAERRIAAYFTLILLVAAAAIPIRPLQMLALALALEAVYFPSCVFSGACDPLEHCYLLALSGVATVLAAASYDQRVSSYESRRKGEQAHEYLAAAQARVLLSENAASLGRLMATLAHELNNPLGALSSAIDSLLAVSARQAAADQRQRERLAAIQADLERSIRACIERLRLIVGRFERLSTLHEAEFHLTDLNDLLRQVAAVVQADVGEAVGFDYDLRPLPALTCQPHQLSAAFSNLLTNAANAMDRSGRVRISTRHADARVEILIQDWGRGIPADELETIFEPGFKLHGARISTGNWSLFSCRQIIHGHGGEIYLTSAEGKGTTAVVLLPV